MYFNIKISISPFKFGLQGKEQSSKQCHTKKFIKIVYYILLLANIDKSVTVRTHHCYSLLNYNHLKGLKIKDKMTATLFNNKAKKRKQTTEEN